MARKVYDDFANKTEQTMNKKLILVREIFDEYNLISGLHSFMSKENKLFKNLLPPLVLLSMEKQNEFLNKLGALRFIPNKEIEA